MFPNDFLHPDHIVPAMELMSAIHEATNHAVSHMGMELGAIIIEVLILMLGIADAGIHI